MNLGRQGNQRKIRKVMIKEEKKKKDVWKDRNDKMLSMSKEEKIVDLRRK